MSAIRIATRGSLLALTQSRWVKAELERLHPGQAVELMEFKTTGDVKLTQSLTAIGGKGAFTKELEDALLSNLADLAVHSLKDLPTSLPEGLVLACTPAREETGDVMLLRDRAWAADPFATLPQGATVGSSSPRRKAQLLARRPDLKVVEFRGNVDTRLRKLAEGQADAILLARAGLKRLGRLPDPATGEFGIHALEAPGWLPAVGQGCLGIEARLADTRVWQMLEDLHDNAAWAEVSAERAFLRVLGAGCSAPVGAQARCSNGRVSLQVAIYAADGTATAGAKGEADAQEAEELGERLAHEVMKQAP